MKILEAAPVCVRGQRYDILSRLNPLLLNILSWGRKRAERERKLRERHAERAVKEQRERADREHSERETIEREP